MNRFIIKKYFPTGCAWEFVELYSPNDSYLSSVFHLRRHQPKNTSLNGRRDTPRIWNQNKHTFYDLFCVLQSTWIFIIPRLRAKVQFLTLQTTTKLPTRIDVARILEKSMSITWLNIWYETESISAIGNRSRNLIRSGKVQPIDVSYKTSVNRAANCIVTISRRNYLHLNWFHDNKNVSLLYLSNLDVILASVCGCGLSAFLGSSEVSAEFVECKS